MTKYKAIIKIIVGNIFMGFAYAKWMKPNNIINGGVTSLSMIVNHITKCPLLILTNGITLLLLVVCWLFLGRQNFWNSCVSSICYNVFFSMFYLLPLHAQINLYVDMALSCVFIAFGYYCCISANASTVGMDVIALIINKKKPHLSLAKLIRWINFAVLFVGLLTFGLKSVVVGVIFSFVNSYCLEGFFAIERKYHKEDEPSVMKR